MNVIVTGASGFLGSHLYNSLRASGNAVYGTYRNVCKPGLYGLDIVNKLELQALFGYIKPDMVINCSCVTGNVKCESDRSLARAVNIEGTCNLAQVCSESGAKLINISTASVFNGKKKMPYNESDVVSPLDFYGETKACAEAVVANLPSAVNIRTMKLIGVDNQGRGFVEKSILGNCGFYSDTPLQFTLTDDVRYFINRVVDDPGKFCGTYHLSSEVGYTQYELATSIRSGLGIGSDINPISPMSDPGIKGPEIVFDVSRAKNMGIRISTLEESKRILYGEYCNSRQFIEGRLPRS